MKITKLLYVLFSLEKEINASKENLLVNYQNKCQNLNFDKTWYNKTGFGVKNTFGKLDYYNHNKKETAIVTINNHEIEFSFIKINNTAILLKYKTNTNNYFTRFIGKWFIDIGMNKHTIKPKTNRLFEFYKYWFSQYRDYDVFSW